MSNREDNSWLYQAGQQNERDQRDLSATMDDEPVLDSGLQGAVLAFFFVGGWYQCNK
ncbi:hypothetical protein OKW43_000126 [Paraburkholderia sp. WC7.3g]|uniref:hypothetical protein n=1 Tax=Paraburkholderia sp. WC7.3g TaxID=2991070 RepID=UPI003D252D7A